MTITRAAIYARISDDRAGAGLGVQRQQEDCAALAKARGWPIAEVFVDNDRSAYSGKRRPEYQRLLEAIRGDRVDAVIAWHPDRLHRSPVELEEFIALVEHAGVKVHTVQAGEYDLSTATGRQTARIVGAVARGESEHKSDRIRRKHEEIARAGRPAGGGTRAFGFGDDYVTHRGAEAEIIREAADRVLTGEALGSICRDLMDRGVPTVTGTRWSTTVLRRILTAPRTAGIRQLRDEVAVKAVWDAILPEATYRQLVAFLEDPKRRQGGRPRTYLLTGGIAVCALCGAGLSAGRKDDGQARMRCPSGGPNTGARGCGKVYVKAEPVEDHVRDVVLAALDGGGLRDALADSDRDDHRTAKLLDDLRSAEAALDQLDRDLDDGLINRRRWLARGERLQHRLEAAKTAVATRSRVGIIATLPSTARALRGNWEAGSVAWRRKVLVACLERVEVGPAVRGRNFFDPDRVRFVWRG